MEVLFLPGFTGTRRSSPEQHESVTFAPAKFKARKPESVVDMSGWYYVDNISPGPQHPQCWRQTRQLQTCLFQLGTETSSLLAVKASGSRKDWSGQVSLVTELGDSTVLLSRATRRVTFFVLPLRFCEGFRPRFESHCVSSFLRDVMFLHITGRSKPEVLGKVVVS